MSHRLAEKVHGAVYSFPNYLSPMGKIIEAHLNRKWTAIPSGVSDWSVRDGGLLDPMVFQAVQLANRMEIVRELAAETHYKDIVLDRYWPSGYAYGSADGLDPEYLIGLHAFLPQPDLFLLLDVDPTTSQERRPERRDRYELDSQKMAMAANNYRLLWHRMSQKPQGMGHCGMPQKWVVIDARGEKDNTFRQVWDAYLGMH